MSHISAPDGLPTLGQQIFVPRAVETGDAFESIAKFPVFWSDAAIELRRTWLYEVC